MEMLKIVSGTISMKRSYWGYPAKPDTTGRNKTKRLDSRKQVKAFLDTVTTVHKGSSTPTEMRKVNSRQIQ